MPGTIGKIMAMEERAERGESLFNPHDAIEKEHRGRGLSMPTTCGGISALLVEEAIVQCGMREKKTSKRKSANLERKAIA
jgi:hypothetical protein